MADSKKKSEPKGKYAGQTLGDIPATEQTAAVMESNLFKAFRAAAPPQAVMVLDYSGIDPEEAATCVSLMYDGRMLGFDFFGSSVIGSKRKEYADLVGGPVDWESKRTWNGFDCYEAIDNEVLFSFSELEQAVKWLKGEVE